MAGLTYMRYFFNTQNYNAICSIPVKNKCLAVGGTALSVFHFCVWINACAGCASLWVSVRVGGDEYALRPSFCGRRGENWFSV